MSAGLDITIRWNQTKGMVSYPPSSYKRPQAMKLAATATSYLITYNLAVMILLKRMTRIDAPMQG